MDNIIEPVDRRLIELELTEDKFVRDTNNAGNKLYIIDSHDSPNIMREIGRLRELTFRTAGGGTGKALDIDDFDTSDDPYKQLIVWDPQRCEILGGYRFHICSEEDVDNNAHKLATSKLFHFSENYKTKYLPYTIELGRSFVQPDYQTTKMGNKALYALDNLWDGLGTLIVNNPTKNYFFGKVTMYKNYNERARNLILYFLEKHFPDNEKLVYPVNEFDTGMDKKEMGEIFTNSNYLHDYKILSQNVRAFGEKIPPLINAYMNLSPSMRTFGTVINPYFGNVEETAIMITITDMYIKKVERHIHSYNSMDKIKTLFRK
jgi:hypothetical protein